MFDRATLRSLRRMVAFAAAVAVSASLIPGAVSAANDKELERVSGTVGYLTADNGAFNPVIGSLPLPDKAFAVTQANSSGILRMPDSSEIGLGANTKVQLAAFNDIRNGPGTSITINNGALKFDIRHPAGKKANYRFVTPTSQIAVRGTIGLIAVTAAANGTSTTTIACVSGTFTATVGTTTVSLAAGQAVTVVGGSVTSSTLGSVVSSFQEAGITSPTGAGAGVGAGSVGGAGATGGAAGAGGAGSAGVVAGGAGAAGAVGAVVASTTNKPTTTSTTPLGLFLGGQPLGAQNQLFASTVPQSSPAGANGPAGQAIGISTSGVLSADQTSVTPTATSAGAFNLTINAFGNGSLTATQGTSSVSSTFSVYGQLAINPTTLSFTALNSAQTFTVQQAGPAGGTISIGTPSCQNGASATVSPSSAPTGATATTISVTATGVPNPSTGSTPACTIAVTGQAAQAGSVSLNISTTSIIIQGKRQALPSTRRPQ